MTDHSNAQTEFLVKGIPVITTSPMRKIGLLKEIEEPPMERDFLKNLAYKQWTIEEIRRGHVQEENKTRSRRGARTKREDKKARRGRQPRRGLVQEENKTSSRRAARTKREDKNKQRLSQKVRRKQSTVHNP